MRPNFLVIGAQKCATSSLCGLLGRHRDVFMTTPKEPYFFSDPDAWARGWSWYESLFEGAADRVMRGEGSTTYTMHGLYPEAAGRIATHLPDARLIYIVRDPLARIQSHWMHLRARENRETQPFTMAVRERPEYLDNSRYLKQIDAYRAHFPDERILVLFFEDYLADRAGVGRRALEFLGVDPDVPLRLEETEGSRHASAALRRDSAVTGVLRRAPFFRRLRDAAPVPIREGLRSVFKRPIGARPEWDAETRAWGLEQLREESAAFLERYGKPANYWPLVA